MRNLLLLFSRFYYIFLFVGLEIFCYYLLISNQHYHKASFFTATNEFVGWYYQNLNDLTDYFYLQKINDSLQEENARLRKELMTSKYVIHVDSQVVIDTSLKQKFIYFSAKVINNSINKRNNFITLNKGSLQGIEKRMGVISTNGVVGIIKNVSPHFSSAISVLHQDFRLSAMIPEINQIGSLVWDGKYPDIMILKDIPQYANVKKGQRVVTSPYSGIFPVNQPIGVVDGVTITQGDNFYEIKVRLNANLRNLASVYIIKNEMIKEQQTLEEAVEE